MNLDDLADAWQRRLAAAPPAGEPQRLLEAARARALELEVVVRRRDRLETGVALALLPVFSWFALMPGSGLARTGALVLALACAFIPLRLRRARRPAPDAALPTAAFLRMELERVRLQRELLVSVAWWYLAPLGVGVVLFFAGGRAPAWATLLYAAAVAALMGWLYRLNLRAVREDLLPREREMVEWLQALEDQAPAGHHETP